MATILPAASYAADCGPLQLFDSVQMIRANGGARELIPITVNGAKKTFIFDTGASFTQIGRQVVDEQKLSTVQGRIQLMDATGHISRDEVRIQQFIIGHMLGKDVDFPVSPTPGLDGFIGLDHLMRLDVDMDFGSDKLNLFSPDHCAGGVLYWKAPAVAVMPMRMDGYHVIIPVTLDGHDEKAVIDTGATNSVLMIPEAQRLGLEMGSADTPESGTVNGDATLKTYKHTFKTLAFGDVQVNNPDLRLIPNAFGRNMDRTELVSSRAKSEKDLLDIQDMIVGMDVLRKLHIYIAFKEDKMYISAASPDAAAALAGPASPAQPDPAAPVPPAE